MDAFRYFLDRFYTVAKGVAAITSKVPTTNITPSFDAKIKSGPATIDYMFIQSAFDQQRKRGTGIFNIEIRSQGGENGVREILEAIVDNLTCKTLSNTTMRLALFREREGTTINGIDDDRRTVLTASFDVKLAFTG